MENYNAQPRPSQPLQGSSSSGSMSRISSLADFDPLNFFGQDNSNPTPDRPVSPVSVYPHDGLHDGPKNDGSTIQPPHAAGTTTPQGGHSAHSAWPSMTGYFSGGYEQVPPTAASQTLARRPSRLSARSLSIRRPQATILEEGEDGVDLGLINHAAPMGSEVAHDDDAEAPYDVSLTLGPSTWQDQEFLKRVQAQEASGQLTGGLGSGMRTGATLSEAELLVNSPVSAGSSLSRSFSLIRGSSRPHRSATLKQLGQNEANKRGEVIEVIMGEDEDEDGEGGEREVVQDRGAHRSEVDLSLMAGPTTGVLANQPNPRRSTLLRADTSGAKSEMFYPQPNWKPFPMRWPYLLTLVILSIGLGGFQEVVYQLSAREPLITFHTPSEIPPAKYFAFKFVPILVAVSYGVMWQVTDFEVKRLEAFYQLSKEGGALAAESINVDYITFFSFLRPFRALRCRHYAVAVSSVATLLANAAVPTLGAAAIKLTPDRDARLADPFGEKSIVVDPLWSRFLSAVLFLIALLGCGLFYILQSRRSGLLSDVKGIAGLASMAVVSHILMDFKDMDVATHNDIHHRLKDHRYMLRNSSLAPDDDNPASKLERERYDEDHVSENPHPRMLRAWALIPYVVGIVFFLALIPIFLFTPVTILTDKAAWVPTLLAVCIKLGWGSLETDVRMMEPYYILFRRHAPPTTLTLDYTSLPFGWVAIRAFLNAHWLVFFVGLGTVMAEFLTVLVTSLAAVDGRDFLNGGGGGQGQRPSSGRPCNVDSRAAAVARADGGGGSGGGGVASGGGGGVCDGSDVNAGQETLLSFSISLGLAVFVLVYMGTVATAAFARRRKVFLPRQPNTIASVLAFIHQSKMLYDFVGTAKLNHVQMGRRLGQTGKTYGFGWFQGRDGQPHCGVDEEELLSKYKAGYDYSKATNPWEERHVDWL